MLSRLLVSGPRDMRCSESKREREGERKRERERESLLDDSFGDDVW